MSDVKRLLEGLKPTELQRGLQPTPYKPQGGVAPTPPPTGHGGQSQPQPPAGPKPQN